VGTATLDAAPKVTAEADRRLRRLNIAFAGFGWVRNIGLILILFAVWQVWGTSIEQAHKQASLRQQFEARVHHSPPPSRGPVLVPSTVRLPEPPEGSVVARLQIPALGVDQYVVEGTAEGDLAEGPGHYIGTAMPGQSGNVAIAGHRTTYGAPFNSLDKLTIGDPITLTTTSGEALKYVVSQPPVAVSPRDVAVLNTFGDNRLTLTTCNPKFSATQRLVVVASLRLPASAHVPRVVPRKVHVVASSTGWNVVYLPGVLLVVALMALLGLANRRASSIYGRFGRWLVLTPVWLTMLYFLFVLLTKFLPATL
jgi:sortase A